MRGTASCSVEGASPGSVLGRSVSWRTTVCSPVPPRDPRRRRCRSWRRPDGGHSPVGSPACRGCDFRSHRGVAKSDCPARVSMAGSIPQASRQMTDWTVRASLCSTCAQRPEFLPAFFRASFAAFPVARPNRSGSTACAARPAILATRFVADLGGGGCGAEHCERPPAPADSDRLCRACTWPIASLPVRARFHAKRPGRWSLCSCALFDLRHVPLLGPQPNDARPVFRNNSYGVLAFA